VLLVESLAGSGGNRALSERGLIGIEAPPAHSALKGCIADTIAGSGGAACDCGIDVVGRRYCKEA
jgi:hypothetical protein